MSNLRAIKCEACRVGAPLATQEEIDEFMSQLPNWQISERDGVNQLQRTFEFNNFVEALAFTNKVGEIAEAQDHHPAILTEWGEVTVTWWSHKIKGLHVNDFIMAAKTDDIV
jgi:4a-hydroxytetrahydrobiopterin dehydratase